MLKDSNRVLPVCYSGLFLQLWRTDDVKHLRNKKQQTIKLGIKRNHKWTNCNAFPNLQKDSYSGPVATNRKTGSQVWIPPKAFFLGKTSFMIITIYFFSPFMPNIATLRFYSDWCQMILLVTGIIPLGQGRDLTTCQAQKHLVPCW